MPDQFEEVIKREGIITVTSGGGGVSGITENQADDRYFRQSQLLSEASDAPTLRSNIGLSIGSDVQAWSGSLDTYSNNPLQAGELQQLQNIDSVTISNTQWGYLGVLNQNLRTTDSPTFNNITGSGLVRGGSLRTDDGKILSPVDYQLRNAGDTNFRNLQVLGLTATVGDFSGNLSSGNDLDVERDAEIGRNLFVRGGLFATEFVVNQKRVRFNEVMAVGGGKISTIAGSLGSEAITFEDENGDAFVPVAANDILRIQRITGFFEGAVVKSIYRRVSNVTGNNVTLSTFGIDWATGNDVGTIEVGDYVIVHGNTTNALRDHRIEFDISGVNIPRVQVWDDVDDTDTGDVVLQWGGLEGWGSQTGIGFAAGDSSLVGNHILLSDSQASMRFDKFRLQTDGLAIDSESDTVDSMVDFGSDQNTSFILDGGSTTSNPTEQTGVFDPVLINRGMHISKITFEIQVSGSSSTNANLDIEIFGRIDSGAWQLLCYSDNIGVFVQDSVNYTLDVSNTEDSEDRRSDLSFFSSQSWDEFRIYCKFDTLGGDDVIFNINNIQTRYSTVVTNINQSVSNTFFNRSVLQEIINPLNSNIKTQLVTERNSSGAINLFAYIFGATGNFIKKVQIT